MKLRTIVIIVAILAALSVVAYVKNRPEPAPAQDARVGKPLLDSDTALRAAGLVASDQGKKVELSRGADGTWVVASYFGLPADFEKVARLVQDLNEAKVDRLVTTSPDRLAHMEFKDSMIALDDASGKEIWSITLGKAPDSGDGRFIRFGTEPKAYFSGMHVWLDTDAKGWANAQLVTLKNDDVAKIDVPLDSGTVVLSRAKKDAPWTAQGGPPGAALLPDKVSSLLNSLTTLRFSDTVETKDPAAAEAAKHMRTFRLTTFAGQTLTVALGRVPEVKKLKAPVADKDALAALAKTSDAKPDPKAIAPEYDVTPAGPVFVAISSSDPKAPVNALMARRAFEVDEYAFTGLPQKADDLFEAPKAKQAP
jgi:hypothetical protein